MYKYSTNKHILSVYSDDISSINAFVFLLVHSLWSNGFTDLDENLSRNSSLYIFDIGYFLS